MAHGCGCSAMRGNGRGSVSYDLWIGTSNKAKDDGAFIGALEFNEYPAICALAEKKDSFFLNRMTNFFEDQTFSVDELRQAQTHLFELLTAKLKPEEQQLLYKLIAFVAYVIANGRSLDAVAD